ncbi:hypothetical protein [Acinetobacter sp. WCHAc060042]|uniref:hypothetical protein n=1 Tax=Acinetobacter sp. WCHAc060042 TaxID=2213016 RepID=UPI0013A617ED|nr:hypothetical protein [Acinetobacter sp. WCHAc060042]
MEIHFIFVIFTLLSEKLYIALNVVMDSSGSDLSLHWLLRVELFGCVRFYRILPIAQDHNVVSDIVD